MVEIGWFFITINLLQSNLSIVTTFGKAKFGDYRGDVTIEGFFLLCLYVNRKAK